MSTVRADEARTRFPELLREVAQGGVITIHQDGTTIARIIPAEEASRDDSLLDAFRTARSGVRRTEDGVGDMVGDMVGDGRR